MMQSNVERTFLALTDQLCSVGLSQVLKHHMKIAENKLCNEGLQSKEYSDEPLSQMSIYFKKNMEKDIPGEIGKDLAIKGRNYKKDDGVCLLTIECAPEHIGRIGVVTTYMQKSGLFRKVLGRRAHLMKTPPGKPKAAELIKFQTHLGYHVSYLR